MKKRGVWVVTLALFAVAPAFADQGDSWTGLTGGISGPSAEFGDHADMGFHGGLTASYFVTRLFGIGADLGYHGWSGSDDSVFGSDASIDAIQVTAHGVHKFQVSGSVVPYVRAGLGVYRVRSKFESETDPASNSDESNRELGFNLGGGVNVAVSPVYMIGVGAGYHAIATDGVEVDFYTVGINLLWGRSSGY